MRSENDSEASEVGARSRTMTLKGLAYTLEQKEKGLKLSFRQLRDKQTFIESLLTECEDTDKVRNEYSECLSLWEEFFIDRDNYQKLLTEKEKTEYILRISIEQDPILYNFKRKVENWFSVHSDIKPRDSVSQVSHSRVKSESRASSISQASSISMAKLKEEQKRAELLSKATLLKQMQTIEMNKLKLKMEEEELKLQAEIASSEAKTKVLNKYEKSLEGSVYSGKSKANLHSVDNYQPVEPVINGNVLLDPLAKPFTPPRHIDERIDSISIVQHLKKPVIEMMKFSGNPLEYKRFMRQFNNKIVVNCNNSDELVNYLDQFTTGEANKIVSGYYYLDGVRAYQAILYEFEERYGNTDIIASAFVKKALDWPIIKADNAKALDEYSIFLTECENAVKSIDAMKILEYPDNIRGLVMKLPYQYHDKWRNIVQTTKDRNQCVHFHTLVDFVRKESMKANDPIYGKKAMSPEQKTYTPKVQGPKNPYGYKTKVFATDLLDSKLGERTQEKTKSFVNKTRLESIDTGREVNVESIPVKSLMKPCIHCKAIEHGLESCNKWKLLSHESKLKFLMTKGLCFRCLKHGHRSKECEIRVVCSQCEGSHQTVLHIQKLRDQTSPKNVQKETSAYASQSSRAMGAGDGECTMAIIPVKVRIKNCSKVIDTYAFLDPGSSVSFCSQRLMQELGCTGKQMKIRIETMGKPHSMYTYAVHGLEVCDLECQNVIELPRVFSKDKLPVSQCHIPTQKDIEQWSHLADISLPQIHSDIDLLIGNNVPDAYTPLVVKTGPRGSPHASLTLLGWVVWNVIRVANNEVGEKGLTVSVNRAEITAIEEVEELKRLDCLVRHAINLDFPERIIDDKKQYSYEDKCFLEKVDRTIKLEKGHYVIALPFRNDSVVLPNNHTQALQRLLRLKDKMKRKPEFHRDYKAFMKNILEKGYAEQVPENELRGNEGRVWFIPHHGVYHPKKPDKIRVVFDCTAIYEGVSLNSLLLQGPDMTNSLVGVFLRFRQETVAIMGDIESMFYQVRVPKEDCDLLRFYWWPDGDTQKAPAVYRMLVHLFGAVSSPSCSSAALRQTATDNQKLYESQVTDLIRTGFYVDDCLKSVPTENEAISLIRDVSSLCLKGGFSLTKWISNSHKVMDSISVEKRSKDVKELDLKFDELPNERALGISWFVETDNLGFNLQLKCHKATRREILKVVSSLYDPLGFVAPFVLTAKILLQNLCRQNMDWDQEISGDILKTWQKWMDELPELERVKLSRCFKPADFGCVKTCQLHMFSDASDAGYGVIAYLRLENEVNHVHCCFVMAKSRVVPLKKITIPRLELTAATMAVKLSKLILDELEYPIGDIYYWTDSMSVIRYIANDTSRFHTFVANRVNVIREASQVNQWKYIDSKTNPADAASRGMRMDKFLKADFWFNGPGFLWKPETEWLDVIPETNAMTIDSDDPEVKKTVNVAVVSESCDVIDRLLCYFSDWMKLKRAVGWILLVFRQLQTLVKHRKSQTKQISLDSTPREADRQRINYLSINVLKAAEMAIIRVVQWHCFPEEMLALSQEKNGFKHNKRSIIQKLDPILHEGIMRVGGRLEKAIISYDAKHPIILPKESHVSLLILQDIHKRMGHFGKNMMMSVLRQQYWMIGAGTVIKRLLSKCVVCRKYQARVLEQKMANLPADRLTSDEPPFTRVGMDYFGPILVKRGRSTVKRYGVIFTCLAIRAVHLEMAYSLDMDSCVNCVRRFIARRGPVKVIRSDNGSNLVSCEKELREEIRKWNHEKMQTAMLQENISWEFNPPAGSHFGGVWERMIRSVRKILYSLMQEQVCRLDDEALQTLFCEVEAILNNRPITGIPVEANDLTPLTPNHLLLLQPGENMPPGLFDKSDSYGKRRWRQVQYLADIFWKRWLREFIPLLQERQKWLHSKRNVKVGDIVLLVDNTPRNSWALAKVLEVIMDKRGFVRIVKVKTRESILVRPIDKLCLILESEDVDVIDSN